MQFIETDRAVLIDIQQHEKSPFVTKPCDDTTHRAHLKH